MTTSCSDNVEMKDADSLTQHSQPFDPLRFDLSAAISSFLSQLSQLESTTSLQLLNNRQRHVLDKYRHHQEDQLKGEVLDILAELLVFPELTLTIAHLFRPLLIDLSARWNRSEILSSFPQISNDFSNFTQVEVVAMAYAKLLHIAPQLKSSAIQFFKQQPSLFERVNTSYSGRQTSEKDPAFTKYLSALLISAYRLLRSSVRSFAGLFNWTPLFQLINYSDQEIRYYVVLCLSLLLEMSDRETRDSIQSLVGDIYKPGDESLSLLSMTEQEHLSGERLKMVLESCSPIPLGDTPILNASDLSASTVNLCGVLLPRNDQSDTSSVESNLVLTSTTVKNLRAIGLALSLGAPVLLEGVTGSGKTALVEEVSNLLGKRDIVKIHLGDQTDSKVLLGTYVSTSTPGSFKWQPGVLTTAVKEGRWVLIEDIDLAPMEVTSVLIPLLETRELFIPSRGERFVAKDGFQLFATRSLMPNGTAVRSSIGNNVMANSLWTRVEVKPLDMDELRDVIEKRYPRLRSISSVIIRVFTTITEIFQDRQYSSITISTMSRFISARDLMKWCTRVEALLSTSKRQLFPDDDLPVDDKTREDIFSEAVDCFCSMISSYDGWVTVLEKVGSALGLSKERVHLYANSYVPSMNVSDEAVQVGRVTLRSLADPSSQVKRNSKRVFAQTNHALRLLERIAVGVHLCEPILLVGETGTGKTTVVQYLAELMHQNLIVVNLSQQSDSSDLLGGFKPVDGKVMAIPLKEEFERLFECTFSMKRNAKFLEGVRKAFVKKQWKRLITLFKEACKMAKQRLIKRSEKETEDNDKDHQSAKAKKARTGDKTVDNTALVQQWETFGEQVIQFEARQSQESKLVFSFIEGSLVKAVRKGYWILLDEINLATTETLECLSGLIQDAEGSILLTEKGDTEPIRRHPNFRVFACMNPATDVGKKDLPPGLRNRFTEFYVHPPDARQDDLLTIVKKYLANSSHGDERACMDVTEFYMEAKNLQIQHKLADGANQRPHYSMRTLSRALSYVTQIAPNYGLRRALFEGFSMTFSTLLNKESEVIMRQLIEKHLLKGVKNPRALITQIPRPPADEGFVQFGHFWLSQGPEVLDEVEHYILTPSVEKNLYNLARVVMSNKYPVLLQGPTSAGKTSMIEYLAKRTGHKFIRINNHEHTDLQEYLGTYVSQDGQLTFQEGALVEALRKGYWIVLDELNLAPSDVLEALNRLLDDNRELLIPETQEVVKPHPHFMLFATQNPAGLYGGRKALSRAFRNRFLELHFDDIPEDELETILARRCQIAPSYCKKLVQVYKQLMEHRQRTRIFDGKHGFITLRDMFRWAGREALGYQELAEHGYMILAERTRREEEKAVVKKVIESVMRAKIDEEKLYDCSHLPEFKEFERRVTGTDQSSVAWTKAMKRLFTLVAQCIRFNEPVLLVGDTGCGKTTVCQMLAIAREQELHIVNCHQNTETSDLLGGQRPLRNKSGVYAELREHLYPFARAHFSAEEAEQLISDYDIEDVMAFFEAHIKSDCLLGHEDESTAKEICLIRSLYKKSIGLFEWHDGPLVQSMKNGDLFLLDEISLADDSVLERLNSVLEPHRLLVLAEKGGAHVEELTAHHKFQFLATMNPGGDYGKKELSPALRNRFTEVWVPSVTDEGDLKQIIQERIHDEEVKPFASKMLDFINWYAKALGKSRSIISLRDVLSWVEFMNEASHKLGAEAAFIHGGSLVLLDGIGSNGSPGTVFTGEALKNFKAECLARLSGRELSNANTIDLHGISSEIESTPTRFGVAPFFISKGSQTNHQVKFALRAPTTFANLVRVLRALQIKKPILLEGSPGVGKTSLISALASASGRNLVRINLSEQTDLMDLFGSDLPVEGGKSGEFAWRDAPFLQAMQSGDWVLLDEINLASQSVLEGLNSCLDHRGSVYIPELDRSFGCAKEFRIFAAQNPIQQGGGRKGLPKSFLNRFTQVYVDQLAKEDLLFICQHSFPKMNITELEKVIEFNNRMHEETMVKRSFGLRGSPWEFNLRDVFRWLELLNSDHGLKCIASPAEYLDMIYLKRMRTPEDRESAVRLYNQVFKTTYQRAEHPFYQINPSYLQVGHSVLPRRHNTTEKLTGEQLHLLHTMLGPLESVMKCVEMNWMAIVTGSSGSGKTSLIRLLAQLTGNVLEEFSMNSGVDTMELLGGFEQVELSRYRQKILDGLRQATYRLSKLLLTLKLDDQSKIASYLQQLSNNLYALEQQHTSLDTSKSQNEPDFDCSLVEHQISLISKCIREFSLSSTSNESVPSESDLSSISEMINILKVMQKETVSGKFEWIDGVLIEALEQGHWILIDNANLCNPSILDRLNPLFETNGVLMVNERGLVNGEVKIIQPHKNFRLFMTVDPQNGELSRAMRNRGVEIVLLPQSWSSDDQDIIRLANNMGIPGSKLPLLLKDIHTSTDSHRVSFNTRNYTLLLHMIVELLQRGSNLVAAVKEALSYVDFISTDDNDHSSNIILSELAEICRNGLSGDFYSPANFPYLINGDFLRKDSALATIVLQSSYLVYLLQEKQRAIESENADLLAKTDSSIRYASTYFIESTCIADIDLRTQLLDFIASHETFSKTANSMNVEKYLLKEITQHSLAKYMEEQKSTLTTSLNLDPGFMSNQPLNLKMNPFLFTALNTLISTQPNESVGVLWANYKNSVEAFELLIRVKRIEHEESALFSKAERIKISNLNLIQQSYCHSTGRLSESQLSNPIVAQLYPAVITLRKWILEKLASFHNGTQQTFVSVAHQLLDKRDIFWQVVQKSLMDFGELSTAVQWLLKATTKAFQVDPTLKPLGEIVFEMSSLIGLHSSKTMKILWKALHPTTLSTMELYTIEEQFNKIQEDWDLYESDNKGAFSLKYDHPLIFTDAVLKRTFIEGLASLYFSTEDSKTEIIIDSANSMLEHIRDKFQNYRELTEKTPEQSQLQATTKLELAPLMDFTSVLWEMEILAELCKVLTMSGANMTTMQLIDRISKFFAFSLSATTRAPSDFVGYQKLLWYLSNHAEEEEEQVISHVRSVAQDLIFSWHLRLWRTSYNKPGFEIPEGLDVPMDNDSYGPARLFQDVYTTTCFSFLDALKSSPLNVYDSKVESVQKLKNHLTTQNLSHTNRSTLDASILLSTIKQLLYSFRATFQTETYTQLIGTLSKIERSIAELIARTYSNLEEKNAILANIKQSIAALSSQVRSGSNVTLTNVFDKYISQAITELVDAYTSDSSSKTMIKQGKSWIWISLGFIAAYIPEHPVDPAVKARMKWNVLQERQSELKNEIHVRESIEAMMTGQNDNIIISEKQESLSSITCQIRDYTGQVVLRPEESQYNNLFNELQYMRNNIINERSLMELIRDLETKRDEGLISRELLFQDTTMQFLQRMMYKYPLYKDVLQPVFVSISQLKYGLRLVSVHSQHLLSEEGNFMTKLIDALLCPTSCETEEGINESIEYLANPDTIRTLKQIIDDSKLISQKLSVLMQYINAVLHKVYIASKSSGYLRFRYLEIADYLFDRLMGIWQLAEEARKKRQIEEQSLYKHKEEVHTALTDEEIEAQELRELFPDFRNEFLDLEKNENDDPQENSKPKKTVLSEVETTTLSEEDIAQVAHLHELLVSRYSVARCRKFEVTDAEKDFEKMFVTSYNVATNLARLAGGHLPYELDRKCRAAHVYVTSIWSQEYSTDSVDSNRDDTYDFYKDSNVLQTRRLVPILNKFMDRVKFLQDIWPEHAVLAQILEVARRISGFPATSPIMKFLTGLELLLQKSEDWQAYTSKEFSLKENLDEIINLIVSWRHLELKCWSKLIQAQDRYIEESALSWWFHLYNSVVKPSLELAARQDENDSLAMNMDEEQTNVDLKEHLNNLLAALDQFLQSSSYGEFKTRHQLLVSFSHHLEQKYYLSHQGKNVWTSVLNAVWNVCQYYGQFLQPVDEAIKKLRKPIEKELIEYVKIASWKDINVYALKQSSAKTHKHLNKFIKKYKDVLRNPVMQIIQTYMSDISFNVTKEPSKKSGKKNKKRKAMPEPTETAQDVLWKDQESLRIIPEETSNAIQQLDQLLEEDLSLEKNVQLLNRFQKFCRDDITKLYVHMDGQVLDSFSGDIISQIKEFQDMVLPATKESEKMLKNQKSIRRKALVDFLKQLRRVGLKYRIRAQAMKQSDFKYVCQLGKIDFGELFTSTPTRLLSSRVNQWASDTILPLWSKSNEYYYKILARMSYLRDIATHSPKDLTLQEVEKGMGFTEHLLSFVMKERETMHKLDQSYKSLAVVYRQWKDLSPSMKTPAKETVTLNPQVSQILESQKHLVDRLSERVYGAILLVEAHCSILANNKAYSAAKQDLEIVLRNILSLQSSTSAAFEMFMMYPKYAVSMEAILTSHVYTILDSNQMELKIIRSTLGDYIQRYPELEYLISSIISIIPAHPKPIRNQLENEVILQDNELPTEVLTNVSKLVQSLLVIVQELRKLQKTRDSELSSYKDYDEFGLRENHISDVHNTFIQTSRMLHMSGVVQACLQVSKSTTALMKHNREGTQMEQLVTHVLSLCVPYLEQYLSVSCLHLHQFLVHHKALNKLCMVVCNTFLTLFTKGYCIPEIESEDQEMDDGDAQGTGVGEGDTSGAQDVSNEIEDEDQVLGTEDQKPQEPDTNDTSKEEENGLDMENDFEGTMEDIIESDKEENEDQSEEEDEEEPEDQMGDFDDLDPNAVDEKIWGDDGDDQEEDEENARDLDDTNQDVGEEESEMVAKDEDEDEQKDGSDKNEKEKAAQESGQDQQDEKDDRQSEGEESGSEDAEEDQEDRVNAEPTEMPEAGNLDLAEDLNLSEVSSDEESDEEEQGEEDMDGEDGDMMDVDEPKSANPEESEGEENPIPGEDADQDESEGDEQDNENDEQAKNDASAQAMDEDEGNDENEDEDEGEVDPENRVGAEEEEQEAEGQEGENPEEDPIDAPDQETDKPQSGSQSNAGMNSAGAVGFAGNEDDNQDAADEPNQSAQDPQSAQNESSMPTDSQTVQNTQNEDAENPTEKENEPNPHRSLSEALEKWKKLKTVSRSEEEEQDRPDNLEEQINEKSQFEFVQDDEDHEADTLGTANEEQMQNAQNQDLAAMDDTEEAEDPEQVADMNIDEEAPDDDDVQEPELAHSKMNPEGGSLFSKNLERHLAEDLDDLSIQEGAGKSNMEIDDEFEETEPLTQEQIEKMREELESNLTKWREDGQAMNNARELWHQYELLTHDLALGLCEQLRLILEPTLATKMKGDYRTGKRLNMKKIIPYIASQFKKDKIWLRRTKPSKRQYQVMIAVDDSKSMSESHSIQLAYETIALVSKSLSLLEVGELSIVSFGQDVKLVHPFDQPFVSEAGAQVIQNFTFRQTKTNVAQLMESSIGLFNDRKYCQSSNAELWQLQLIISDGVCEDHGKLQALVRSAAEQRIMVVFIILDNKPEKDSIMAINSIQYKTINGKLSMSMVRYLDTFPFEYYVILRDINSLPEVLSDALRQYFSLVNGS